jgi:hypothetical protein
MTIETAILVLAAGIILVAALIWQTHRRTSRRLAQLQNNLDTLHQEFHWLFVKGLNEKSEDPPTWKPAEKIKPRRRSQERAVAAPATTAPN